MRHHPDPDAPAAARPRAAAADDALCARRRGFTLIEVLVVLVISGILTSVVFQVLLGHNQVARLQTAREEVQQNARTALELISSELRGVGPSGVIAAEAQKVTVNVPVAWGLVCGYTAANQLVVAFPTESVPAAAAAGGFLALPLSPGWTFWNATDATASSLAAGIPLCASLNPSPALQAASAATSQVRVYSGAPISPDLTAGVRVYLAAQVDYSLGADPGGMAGIWILRNNQPLAGPVPPGQGLSLTYLDAAGQPLLATGTAAQRDQIRQVQVHVTTSSRTAFNGVPQHDEGTTVVSLRNR